MTDVKSKTIYFGAGCFWCSEAIFSRLKGVRSVVSGYAGGSSPDPTYESVNRGDTGHAEVVKVVFDPAVISLKDLLSVFFATHDPTTPDRQGYDVGSQYRSLILTTDEQDRRAVSSYIAALTGRKIFRDPIVTEVKPANGFYPAEDDHVRYYDLNRNSPYCQVVIDPKVSKLRKIFARLLR